MKAKLTVILTASVLFLFLIFLQKYIQLSTIVPDGDGIGIYILAFEINDRVPYSEVYRYSSLFGSLTVCSGVLLVVLMTLCIRVFKKKSNII